MKTKKTHLLLIALLAMSLLLGGCTPAEATTAPEVIEPTEVVEPTPMPEPTDVPTAVPTEVEIDPFTEAELDESFDIFLDDMEAYNTIGLEAFATLLVENPDTFILDVRRESELADNGWIPDAVHVELSDLADHVDLLPAFDTTIVSYCGSGWRCTIALTALESMGWEDVLGLKGGSFGGWIEAGYAIDTGEIPMPVVLDAVEVDPAVVAYWDDVLEAVPDGFGVITADDLNIDLVENADLFVIDVRTEGEIEEKGRIDAPNWDLIPLQAFIDGKVDWPADLDTPIVVYCGSGHRSTIAMTILWAYGYTDVHSLKGGYGGWTEAGYATVGGPPDLDTAFATFLAGMEKYNTIGPDDLNLMIVEGNAPFLLDVREPGELLENGWIEGAVHVPVREIGSHLDLLPSFDTTIVSYCASGWRCTIAATALEGLGWENVLALKGDSFTGWATAGYPIVTGDALPEAESLAAASPDPAMVELMTELLAAIPSGFGGITTADLNTTLLENAEMILIDVRTDAEVEEKGVIAGANVVLIPLQTFIEMQDMWPTLDAPIVVYCGSGHRSTIAMTILWAYGFTDVRSLKGGFTAWVADGYGVETAQ